jgi:23S rRNA (cytidine1920-2'-O)/16S rRNA (cytidine1409-2'-O)-methyltransferase
MSRRADERLVELGLTESRARAQAEIKAGTVTLEGRIIRRPSERIDDNSRLDIARPDNPWVSRGALKLADGFAHFGWDVSGVLALDLGASTGGFTQVLLARGARRVYAVDVGHGQIDASLRADPRVIVLERTNARDLNAQLIAEPIDLIVADVSFISLKLVLPPAMALANRPARLLALVKPQFECGPGAAKKGVVRDGALRSAALDSIAAFIACQTGWSVVGWVPSPIKGGEGNEETLIAAARD